MNRYYPIIVLALLLVFIPSDGHAHNRIDSDSSSTLLAAADSAFNRGNLVRAALTYGRVLKHNPNNSRAVYQLARLMPPGSRPAIRLFRRYVSLEPLDPWGHMALGDALAKAGNLQKALRRYDQAIELAPAEQDVWIGLGKIFRQAGQTDASIAAFKHWTSVQPREPHAWRALGRARHRAGQLREAISAYEHAQAIEKDDQTADRLRYVKAQAAPVVIPLLGSSWDSDGNSVYRGAVGGKWIAFDRTRVGLRVDWATIEAATRKARSYEFSFAGTWRPRSSFRLDSRVGLAQTGTINDENAPSPLITPLFYLRARWRAPARGARGELRLKHSPVISSPLLVSQQVVLKELRWSFSAPVYRLVRLRGLGRIGMLESNVDQNVRIGYGGALALDLKPGFEVSGQYRALTYSHSTQAGYFAPDRFQTVELASYIEPGGLWPLTVAFEIGIGAQRTTLHDQRVYSWDRALRLWAFLAWQFQPGRQLSVEIESYDSASSGEALTSSLTWRYGAAILSLRWGF
ncbi:tetratricopeptide repeat protein [candidate division KSB1 bacterium]|nr:tetratricopeptide repeat protein [candidate division KSB1 bacterium]NIV94060.1 tetratricopeptide repeat protein [candidate division KSB1 bacterium]NIX72520.1 tetratricopeptide repeat protein [candidate division KSB1 bacterium]